MSSSRTATRLAAPAEPVFLVECIACRAATTVPGHWSRFRVTATRMNHLYDCLFDQVQPGPGCPPIYRSVAEAGPVVRFGRLI
ncbi:hypothetical protein KIH31_04925 [Paenarthrobacter sp. DKR-5]|uniref:hypothetical protein n=1 Tax=Paenarthrobacter sp. DKR-5 TaxID=2835535 RepID=UPI001BDCF842|nr:hypothetical protein [Paenarthrobacter sp. DKR-5]MBT1001941.1 hypothetical protein [Paenarthrobacter sp. DKR-5]